MSCRVPPANSRRPSSLGLALPNGGTAGLFWNYFIASIGFGFVYASIAELGSMFPTSGGQYYWVAVLAPRRYRRYLSFITGKALSLSTLFFIFNILMPV